jgi:catechol 2,3-dioxygenase-like lactoylglutathione lyase family enzyme
MGIAYTATKLVVRDVPAAELFYTALGLKVVGRNLDGEGRVRQEQSWLSASGNMDEHLLILTRFVELPPAETPAYPGETWLCLRVDDIDAALAAIARHDGRTVEPPQDRPEHFVRAAVAADHEGHLIELVAPLQQ